ncbi:MAG: RNA polymerase sigma factor [Candidatus Latescibacterota bacterium]|jgi:RNA polymerase sigma factor (sigma-70 family)
MDVDDLYQRYGPMVVRRCRQLLRDEEQALDAAHDVFVRVLERRDKLKADYPSSLLYRMATNLCLNRIRDTKRRGEIADDGIIETIAHWEDTERRVMARSILEKLFGLERESTRTMALLHYVDGLTLEQVASEVGMSVSGVRKRLRGLRANLRELEENYER